MRNAIECYQRPDANDLRAINQYKRTLSWGDVPPFYDRIAKSAGQLDGALEDGFDNAISKICNPRYWSPQALKAVKGNSGEWVYSQRPKVAMASRMDTQGFYVNIFPMADGKPYLGGCAVEGMDFLHWDPATMQAVIRIPELARFIGHALKRGDDADKALIVFLHQQTLKICQHLHRHLQVEVRHGPTIKRVMYDLRNELKERDSDYRRPLLRSPAEALRQVSSLPIHRRNKAARMAVATQ